ncbi:MAG: hypothetical protein KIT84_21855 [Labilithrix sp.]|nr:hypothetical protein [Labilithrix sp.]MCW5813689.1 hypothetical protein [Labilithrix sp.]
MRPTEPTEKTKRARRRREPLAPAALASIANALAGARAGYELCARRTNDPNVAVAVISAANSASSLLDEIAVAAATHGLDVRPRLRMTDRLRWEWVASTGSMMEKSADARVLAECARVLGEVVGLDVSPLGESIASRVRLASAEAWSLAAAVDAGARWRSCGVLAASR